MFKKLRNKFILTNMIITSIVLVMAFSIVYVIVATSIHKRPPISHNNKFQTYIDDGEEEKNLGYYLDDYLNTEREDSLRTLLISLIITGVGVEIIVFFISLYLAETAIAPVKNAYRAQKEFIANASHEIKTPLAVIQANLEAADIKNNHWIDNIAIKTEELTTLNNDLLTLARIEAGTLDQKHEKIHLKTFVKDTITPLKPQITAKKATLKLRTKNLKKPELTLNKPALRQLLNILLDNAIKYSDKEIIVTLKENQISIQNDGATISQKDLPHIFNRFYQTDKTKNGVGLGLAIAKKLAETNHWKLEAVSDTSSTTFTIML
ncbi:HAMP domain-containing histidine kinase [Candidatus Saccharibacteria bacterium]|nr:HAMP domain-containing histidine kinase [Candidatus Saccharibacteria bacterium]